MNRELIEMSVRMAGAIFEELALPQDLKSALLRIVGEVQQLAQLPALSLFPLQAQQQGPPLGQQHPDTDGREQRKSRCRADPQHLGAGFLVQLGLVHLDHQQPFGTRHITAHPQLRHPPVIVGGDGHPAAGRVLGDDHPQRQHERAERQMGGAGQFPQRDAVGAAFGDAGRLVVVEELLEGPEVSVLALS